MKSIEFQKWWKEFMRNHDKDNDNGHSMMNELKWTLNGYSIEKRNSFINHLIADNKLVIASDLIPDYGSPRQKVRLRLMLIRKLIYSYKNENYDYLLLSILKSYKSTDVILIRLYFLINLKFNSEILKALYKLNKDIFLIFFDKLIRKVKTKSYEMTVFFRDNEIKDYLLKHGDREILLKIQSLYNDIRFI